MSRFTRRLFLAAAPFALGACTLWVRHPAHYRDQILELVEAQSESISRCYDKVLVAQPDARGHVVVSFVVAKKTGRFERIELGADSTVPPAVSKCVTDVLTPLVLDPPDQADGELTLVWRFRLGESKAAGLESDRK